MLSYKLKPWEDVNGGIGGPEVYSSPALAAEGQRVRSDVPAACWEGEGKAGLRPRGTSYSPACSAQSLPPCLPVFVEKLIKEQSALRGLSTSGSFGVDEPGHPIMFPSGVRSGMWVCTDLRVPAREQAWKNPARAPAAWFGARLNVTGIRGWEWMVSEFSSQYEYVDVCSSDQ